MRLSVTTESDSCSLEVSEDLELENFKALCEMEVNIPSASMTVLMNGLPLVDDKKTLQQLGLQDGDLVMVVRGTTATAASHATTASPTPAAADQSGIPQLDFSSIAVPSSVLRAAAAGRRPPPAGAYSGGAGSSSGGGGGWSDDDPAVILDLLKTHPEQLARLSHNNPALAEAANKGLDAFARVLREQQEVKAEKERQRIRMLTADPFDPEAQKLIANEIQKENIDANMEAAMEYNPESFGTVQMLYINCSVNGFPVKAFIDSGAQTTIMSEACARRCHIMRLVDQRWAGVAKGVGTQKIIGRVHMVQLEIERIYLASSFCILQEQPMDMLLGLDMLKRHQMVIDLQENVLKIGTSNTTTAFLSDAELPECARLTQATQLRAEENARLESTRQAQESEDHAVAEALAASASDVSGSSNTPMDTSDSTTTSTTTTTSSSTTPSTTSSVVSSADVSEIMSAGFSREEAVAELHRQGGDKTQALAALFAKKLSATMMRM